MKNPSILLRILPAILLGGLALWISLPGRAVASYRTYTADYVPERVADGFDFPVGRNGSASGYYMARKMTPNEHLGDDWNGMGGGNSDYGDPVYSIADGIVVYSQNYGSNWGQVVIIRHKYRENDGAVRQVDSLYGHVINRRVSMGDIVRRGEQVAQIGSNNGMYLAHLHLEIRSNTDIGIQSWNFSKGLANYYRPDQFIARHRPGKLPYAGLRLASATPESKPDSVPGTPASPSAGEKSAPASMVAQGAERPVPSPTKPAVASVSSTTSPEVQPKSAVSPVKAIFAAFAPADDSTKSGAPIRRKGASLPVVDELSSPVRRSKPESKAGSRVFFASASPDRDRRSRKIPAGTRAAAVESKCAADRRRSFGKQ